MYTTIKTLWIKGHNKSEISQQTGHDWKTVAKVIKKIEQGEEYPSKKKHPRRLDDHKEKVVELLETGLSSVRIHQELIALGIKVGYSTVKNFVSSIKRKTEIFMRVHTKPGEEAQVDFGYVGYTKDNNGKKRKTWVFNMRLSYSRMDYYEKVYDQKVETFINCHINAFNFFGGVPECVKIDNLKAAILEANFYEPVYQRVYKNFAGHYGFMSIPCRVYRPNDKGKVESGIKYIKQNFFAGRQFESEKDLDRKLKLWMENTCNTRIHGTIKKVPQEVFETEEKKLLKKLPLTEFSLAQAGTRKVYHDCHVYVNYNYYSVPFEHVGQEVDIELRKGVLRIYYHGVLIAVHQELSNRGNFSTKNEHYPKYKCISQTEYQEKYQAKMSKIGPYSEQLFFLILQNKKKCWHRTIQGILSLLKKYPSVVLELSCKRALAFNVDSYQIIKNMCVNSSYKLPIDEEDQLCKR